LLIFRQNQQLATHTPGFVGRFEMTTQPLFQFGTVTLYPTPDRRMMRRKTALEEQLFDIAERERVAKIPAHKQSAPVPFAAT
jgi:hypothetical protein